jgi:hypothetical protein
VTNKPSASISQISFSGGQIYSFESTEKIILVGPNNSGKSQSLREIHASATSGKFDSNKVVTSLKIQKTGTVDDLKSFLDIEASVHKDSYRYKDWELPKDHLRFWSNPYIMHSLGKGFIKNIIAESRLSICRQQESIAPSDQKSKPQHVLYDDEALMSKISDLFRRAFANDIFFDFRGGNKLPIHVGNLPKYSGIIDRVSNSYVNMVRKHPPLDQQGDGMKSYAGILLEAVVSNVDITLLDEPEAFLHPPQMRRLGETLAQEVNGQLIVATHSSDIMRGFLEGTKGNVRILRISREDNRNVVTEASPEAIRGLWEKPELRYSNALEGVFHEQTIICEDDSDCRLINSVADHLELTSKKQWKDTAYVPTGGKHGIPKIAQVLHSIGVPIKAVFDIDFLSERSLVKSTVEAFGGTWDEFESLWTRVDAAVRNGNKPKSGAEIKTSIIKLLEATSGDDLPKGDISELMKQGKPWAEVKKYGSAGIPKGHAQKDYTALRDKLEALGIFVVPVGEMENFHPEIGGHGPKYVTELLSTIPLGDPRLATLCEFVTKVHEGSQSLGPTPAT